MAKKFKKAITLALLTLSLTGIGGSAASALTINVAGGTFNFGVNTIAALWFRQYAEYTRSGWHSATAMMNKHYVSSRVLNGTAAAYTNWYTDYYTNNSYYSVG